MKTVYFIFVILVAMQTDVFSQSRGNRFKVKSDTLIVDSLEYNLIILDTGFETWLTTKPSKDFYSKEYYEQKNRLYVIEWNHRYMSAWKNGLCDTYIDYDPDTDYGLDINYKLYYYFRYFEETNKVKLFPTAR
jgi:hypothetical protein